MMDKLDMILIMSVNPGFGGQSFIPQALNKLREARRRIDAYREATGRDIWLEVDGGVKVDNIAEIAAAGADTLWRARPSMALMTMQPPSPRCGQNWPK